MLNTKLKELRKVNKITQEQLAEIIGVERSSVGKYESPTKPVIPSPDIITRIADYFNVSVDYLLDREAKNSATHKFNNDFIAYDNIYPIKKHKIPLLGEIACGTPIFAEEDRESYVEVGTDIKADFCLKAHGDSMINARILDGDIVFIREQPMVENGEIAAVIIDDEATLKRVYYERGENKIILSPENAKYKPLVYIGEELNSIRILGKAVAFQSDVI